MEKLVEGVKKASVSAFRQVCQPDKDATCIECNQAFAFRERNEAKLTPKGWVHGDDGHLCMEVHMALASRRRVLSH